MRFQCLFCNFIIHIDHSEAEQRHKCPSCDGGLPILYQDSYILGRVLGDFIIKYKIGEGASGDVFLAHQISLDRLVALKVFPKTFPRAGALLNEARISASLSHPNLISVLAAGEEEGTCFIAMDYIEGISLQEHLETKGFIPVDEALHIIQQAAEALHFAWTEKQVVHKYIRPDNIMLSKNGVVKVDIGFAMAAGERKWFSAIEDIRGSAEYMSTEALSGRKTDIRSTIYSLGVVLYWMQTGELPFYAATFKSPLYRIYIDKSPKKIPYKNLRLPEKVGLLISKMLEQYPEKRHQGMEELIKEIIVVRKLTAQDKDFIPSLHAVSFKKPDSGIRRELLHAKSREANLNFVFKGAKFIRRTMFLKRRPRKIGVNPKSDIAELNTSNWTKTVERVRRFEEELNRVNSFQAVIDNI